MACGVSMTGYMTFCIPLAFARVTLRPEDGCRVVLEDAVEAKESILRICLASLQSSLGSEAPSSVSESLLTVEQQVILTFPIFQYFFYSSSYNWSPFS